ncbi:hypothetical protein GCM10029976_003430 [Kribbella albertanoniae]
MTAYWLAQGVGVIAFLIGITTFFNRDERRFKKQLSVYSAVIGVHFFLLGTYPAGASAILNAIRTLITLRTRSLWVMAIFIVLTGENWPREVPSSCRTIAGYRHDCQYLGAVPL